MPESLDTICMQRRLNDLGTTAPASPGVFKHSAFSRTESEFISASTRLAASRAELTPRRSTTNNANVTTHHHKNQPRGGATL